MTALARAGWRTLSLTEFGMDTPHAVRRTLLLTFDDGYASLAEHAYPVLADLGFTAITFLITDYVGKANTWDVQYTWNRLHHLSWPQIEQWRARGSTSPPIPQPIGASRGWTMPQSRLSYGAHVRC
jgi:hypothetical protein